MAGRYATPTALKAALEHRLQTEQARSGMPLARLRQMAVFERFLARATGVFGDALTVKGGVALELRLERARTTRDLDVRLVGNAARVLAQLQEAGQLDLEDFMAFEVRVDAHHPVIDADGMVYQGRRFRVECRLAGKLYASAFCVDVAFAEPMGAEPETVSGQGALAFAGIPPPTLRLYPLEAHIAEKLHAYTLPRRRPNTRVKDLPDLALLGSIRDLDGGRLRRALEGTFRHRGTHPLPTSLPAPLEAWVEPYARMAEQDGLPWPDLETVYGAAAAFLDGVLASPPASTWRAGIGAWERP